MKSKVTSFLFTKFKSDNSFVGLFVSSSELLQLTSKVEAIVMPNRIRGILIFKNLIWLISDNKHQNLKNKKQHKC